MSTRTKKYLITKRVLASNARAALKQERGDILAIVEEREKQDRPVDYSPAIGFTVAADDDDNDDD